MKKFGTLCVVASALAALAFTTPAISQEYNNRGVACYETVSVTKEAEELTKREAMESLYRMTVHAFKTGDNLEKSLKKTGADFNAIVKSFSGRADDALVKALYGRLEGKMNVFLSGDNSYLIKKVVYPKESLDNYVKVVDSQSTGEFNTVVLSADNPRILGYKQEHAGLEVYLVRADSREEAINKTYDEACDAQFNVSGFYVSTPKDLKKFDKVITKSVKNPSKVGKFFDLIGI